MKSVAVYCGHQFGTDPAFARDAKKVGELLARNKIRLVWGGGNVGLMGTVAGAAIENGGDVIGISTHHVIARQEPVHEGAAKIEVVEGINERKQRMFELSDAFCILPGGLGTLNELTDILTMQQVGESKKPVYFLNTHNYWNSFSRIFVHMQQNGFIANVRDYRISAAMTPEELLDLILEKR
ncbi:MAG: TIGR00730 family Rossman fold protein [Alphaproteobacteria bacterium]|nr:TIGR00730 family Rossman fold protein [Alphaproteobacteria bacterium]